MLGGGIRPYRTHKHVHPNARRRPAVSSATALIGTILCLAVVLLFVAIPSQLAKLIVVLLASLVLAGVAYVRRFSAPVSRSGVGDLIRDEQSIRQISVSGETVSRIDLSRPFEWQRLDDESGEPFYRLYQGTSTLDFDPSDPAGEVIAFELLGSSAPGNPFG